MNRLLLFLASVAWADDVRFERIATVDAPGTRIEIVKYEPISRLLLGTDPEDRVLDILRVRSFEPPELESVRRVPMPGEPTSVAIHPDGKTAFVAVADPEVAKRGTIRRVDLSTFEYSDIPAGYHPDSLAVSPDGRWVIVANEAEADLATPGSIGVLKLAAGTYEERPGLAELIGQPIGVIEPEFVAISPDSRLAAVSCQENDCVVLLNLQGETPKIAGIVRLPSGSEPDGVDILDDVMAVAEEGRDRVSFFHISAAAGAAALIARVDLRPLVGEGKKKSLQPESIRLVQRDGRMLAIVGIERADLLLCLDLADPAHPRAAGHAKSGSRPEGLTVAVDGDSWIVITGDEGKPDEPGTTTFSRLEAKSR